MRTEKTAVLVVGGGLVGLSTAMFLSWHGVPTVLIERHPGSSPHPRAIGYTNRTMELYRAAGLGDMIPSVRRHGGVRRIRVASLAGEWFEEQPWSAGGGNGSDHGYSPCGGAGLAQDRLEPILRDRAGELGADIRMSTELVSFEQDTDGVTALLRDADGDYAVRAAYLVAADGHRSPVRTALGIGRDGYGHMWVRGSVLFRAPLEEYLANGFAQFMIDQPDVTGMLTTYGDGRWAFFAGDTDMTAAERVHETLAAVTGLPDLDFEIITTGRWEVGGWVADRFADGRVFLAGDAAHTLPPNRGGYSANTGIEDAHNLAWKLSAVLGRQSAPALLDTYETERRPIAWLCHDDLFAREDWRPAERGRERPEVLDDDAMAFGKLYRSTAVLDAGPDLPAALRPEQWAGQPGTRAPHLWLDGGMSTSTVDLLQPGWVLLAEDERWLAAAATAGERTGVPVRCELLGERVDPSAFRAAYGLGPRGAALVRPDGYLGWRTAELPEDATDALTTALATASHATAAVPVA